MLLIFLSVVTSKSQELEILGYWDFNDTSDPAASSDVTGSSPDLEFIGGASYSNDGDGVSDGGGDYALDLGGVNDGSLAQTPEGDHLNTAYDNNAMSVAFWQNTTQVGNTSSFWIHSPTALVVSEVFRRTRHGVMERFTLISQDVVVHHKD